MTENTRKPTWAALLAMWALVASAAAQPQPFELDWHSIDGGGEMFSISRALELGGTLAQPDAAQSLSGGGFELVGGFWAVAFVGQAPPCPGDLNGDGVVDLTDLTTLLSHFGTAAGATFADGDSDGDGDVDLTDLSRLLSAFGASCL